MENVMRRAGALVAGLMLVGASVFAGAGVASADPVGVPASVQVKQFASGTVETSAVPEATGVGVFAASWHFWASYWTFGDCVDAAPYDLPFQCRHGLGTDGRWKYHLYVWY